MSVENQEQKVKTIQDEINELEPHCNGTHDCPNGVFCGSINFSACGRIEQLKSAMREEGRKLSEIKRTIANEKTRIAKIENDRLVKIENDRLAIIETERLRIFEEKRLADIEEKRLLDLSIKSQELESFYEIDEIQNIKPFVTIPIIEFIPSADSIESISSIDSVNSIDSMPKQIPLETVTPVLVVLGIGLVSYYLLKGNKK